MLAGVDSGRGNRRLVSDYLPEVMTPLGRFYVSVDGWPIPSVTTILKLIDNPKLRAWRERVGDDEADRRAEVARGIGNRFHAWAETYNTRGGQALVPTDDLLLNMASCYTRYAMNWNIRPIGAEVKLSSTKWSFAGSFDLCAEADFPYLPPDTISVADYKTSGQPGELWALQLAAYSIMVEERGYVVGDVRALRLDKDKPGEMGIIPYPDPVYMKDPAQRAAVRQKARRAFLSSVTLWHWLHQRDVAQIANRIYDGRLVPVLREDIESDDAA